jgi:hypothetical protein
MMMDQNQANTVTAQNNIVSMSESPDATKKRFDGMLNNGKMTALLSKMGLSAADFADVIKGSGDAKINVTIGEGKSNIIGAVASLKTTTPDMAIMPAGTMRFAKNGS